MPISAWGGCWVCAAEIGLGWWVCIGFVDSVGLGLYGGGLGLCRGLGWLNRWLEVDFVYWVCCGWVFGGGGWAVVGFSVVVVGLWLGFRWWWFFGGWACQRGLGLEVDFVGFGLEVDGGAVDSAWWLVTGMSLVGHRNSILQNSASLASPSCLGC